MNWFKIFITPDIEHFDVDKSSNYLPGLSDQLFMKEMLSFPISKTN